jgi:thymidylate kinase
LGGSLSGQAPARLVVEFVGLPGAGKSTVADLLTKSLASRGRSWGDRWMVAGLALHRTDRYGRLIRFYLSHPSELRAAVALGWLAPSLTPLRFFQGLRFLSVWSYRLARARRLGYQVLILDQGVLQGAWSLLVRGWQDHAVLTATTRVISGAQVRYALVFFDVGVEVAVNRITQRKTRESSFDHLSPDEARRQLEIYETRLLDILRGVAERTGAAYLQVDATRDPGDTSAEIEAFIEAQIREDGRPSAALPR